MFLLFILLSLIIGFCITKCFYIFIPLALILIFFAFKRGNKYVGLVISVLIPLSCGISFIKIDNERPIYEGIVIDSKENYFLLQSGFEKYYIYSKENTYEIGDILSISGNRETFNFANLESDFNFNEYLFNKGVYYSIDSINIEYKFYNPIRIKYKRNSFLSNFSSSETKSLVGLILFSSGDESDIKNNAESLHLGRLFSASGLYFSFFILVLEYFLKKKFKDSTSSIISRCILIPYFIFVFPKITVIKIFLSLIVRVINKFLLKDKLSRLSLISLPSLIMLIFNIHLINDIGFILCTFIPLLSYFINGSFRRIKGFKKKLLMMFLIYLFFIPFELKFYNELSLFSLPLQIILSPFLYFFAFLSLLCFYKIPLFSVLDTIGDFYSKGLSFIKPLNISLYASSFSYPLIFLYYALFLFILYLFSIRFKLFYKLPTLLFSTVLIINFVPIYNSFSSQVTFINVGQGDSMLLRVKNHSMLIDTGGLTYKDVAKDCLIPFFKSQRIYSLDYVIITHSDFDHSGALDSLISNFKVNQVISSPSSFPIQFESIIIENLNVYGDKYEDENDKSLVCSFYINQKRFLCMGDASTSIENELIDNYINIKTDILKLGHHGSETSSSYTFLKEANPKEAIISCGLNNKYHHPDDKIVKRLKDLNISYKRTDEVGSISYYF